MTKENRNYKDTVFRDLFGSDEKADDKFIQLYNALHGVDLSQRHKIQAVDIEQVWYMNLANDIARMVDGKIVVLIEHQSTVNENMPLRCLEYIARIYEKIQAAQAKYQKTLIKIPTPEFYVLYNGIDEYPLEKELKLSDAFIVKNEKVPLELCVEVININTSKGHQLLKKCSALYEYSLFIDKVRQYDKMGEEDGYTRAIEECIKNNILKEYLERKSKEVRNMLVAEYDYEMDIAVQRRESFEQGIEEGFDKGDHSRMLKTIENMRRKNCEIEFIAEITGLSIEEIKKL